MSAALQAFHFLHPAWLLALLALPPLLWLGTRRRFAELELSRLVDPELLPHLLHGRAAGRRLPLALLALGWTLVALALAGPCWDRVAQPLYAQRAAQVVAISLSQRMLAHDVAPSRMDRALYKAHALLEANRDGLNGLIGYAGEAFVVAPLTADAHSLDSLLDAMAPDTMPVDGDNAAAAIKRGVKLIQDAKASGGSLVLITDGADEAAQAAARQARAEGVTVSVLGVGTPQGGPIQGDQGLLRDAGGDVVMARRDDAALAALAEAGGGRYVPMGGGQDDVQALQGELHAASAPTLAAGMLGDEWQDRGPWLLLPVLLIAAMAFRRGWLLLLPLVLLPLLPVPAEAAGWRDWWQRPDQQAASALDAGQAKQAQALAQDPAWRGAAAYRAGDYAAAASALNQASGADAPYNLGNALARQGRYEQAIQAYDRALKLDPGNADAKANRDAVEAALHKQQQQKQDQQSKKDDKNGQGQGKGQAGADSGKKQDPSNPSDNKQPSPAQATSSSKPEAGEKPGQDGKQQGADQSQPAGKQDAAHEPPPKAESAQEQAAQQARTAQAQQALQKQMDQALAGHRDEGAKQGPQPHQLGVVEADDPQAKLPDEVRQTLQRVPDDPGALLRRKFQLEYQRHHAGLWPQEDQP